MSGRGAVRFQALVKPHGEFAALKGVNFEIKPGAFFALLFVAAYRLPGGMAAVLGAIQPLIVAGFSIALLGQKPSRLTLLAGAIGVGGVALVVLQAVTRPDPIGVAAGLGGAIAMATGIFIMKNMINFDM